MRARQAHDRYASLTWLIIVMTVVVLVIGTVAAWYVESRLVASKGESLALAASEIAHKLDLLLAEQYDDTLELSRTHVFRKRGGGEQSAYLATVKKIHPIYLWLGVADAGGRIVAATDPATIGKDLGGSSWFQAARDTGRVHVGDVEPFVEAGGTDAISFTAPIEGAGGEFQGVVTTRVGLSLLEDVVARTIRTFQAREESGGNLEYKFVTTRGAVFIDSDLIYKGNINLKRMGLSSALLSESGQPGYFEEEHLHRHVPVVTGYARTQGAGEFPGLKWTVLLRTDKNDLVEPIRSVLWKLAAAWVLVWLPMLGFSLWSAGRLKKEWAYAQDEHAHAATAESKYRQLVDQARDIIYRTDDQERFTFVNPIVTRIMGYSPQELLGRRFLELIRPDARANAERFYGWQFARKTPGTYYEFPAIAKDGREVWIGQNVQALLENGRVAGFHAVARDITERKQTEEAQQQSEERFRSAFGHAAIGMALVSTDGRWLQVNPALCDIVGYSEPELLATTFQAITHPDDLDADLAHVRQMLAGEIRYYQMEKRYIHKRGHPVWILLSVSLVRDREGNPLHFIGLIQDITERKRAERRLRERSRQQAIEAELSLLAATVRDLSSLLDTAAKLASNALEADYCEVLELLPNGSELRLHASAGWKSDRIGQVRAVETGSLAHAALQSNKPVIRALPDNARFGGPPWLHGHGAVGGMNVSIPGKESPWGVLGVYTAGGRAFSHDDVNFLQTVSSILATAIERMQAESVLRSANQALRLLSRQLLQVQEDDRRAIARDLHDEIGQSLTAIKLNVERAQRTPDRDARTRIMQDCAQITERVLGQVRDLSLDLRPSILDDLGLAYALRWYADRQAERAGLKVEVTADPSLPRLPQDIEIACFRIAQEALTNVVRHARASRAGITLKRSAKRVELRIQDDGIGFDIKAVQGPMGGGTSIGLTGMRERARLVGGEVHVASDLKKGTEVTAIVPLPSIPSADTQAPPS